MADAILTLNAGSSSIKFALYPVADPLPVIPDVVGQIEGIGGKAQANLAVRNHDGGVMDEHALDLGTVPEGQHHEALVQLIDWIEGHAADWRVVAVGHRVVHGGPVFAAPALIDDTRLQQLRQWIPLAPLHQPHNVAGIEAMHARLPDVPQVFVNVDRDKVLKQGVALGDVYQTLQAFMGGYFINFFNRFGRQWRVFVEAEGDYRTRAAHVGKFYVRNRNGATTPLSAFTRVEPRIGPEFVMHYNEYRSAQINGSAAPGYSSSQATRALEEGALTGARLRLRPILMTSFAFILGCVPLWLAFGSGAISRQTLGTVVIGGMLAATCLAIFLIPVTFCVVERLARRRQPAGGGSPPAAAAEEHSREGES